MGIKSDKDMISGDIFMWVIISLLIMSLIGYVLCGLIGFINKIYRFWKRYLK